MGTTPWGQTGFYSNLTNGVSQQPYRVRLESQLDAAVNMYPTTFHQAGHRPPLEIVSELDGLDVDLDIPTNGYPNMHGYVRDASESYEIVLDGDGNIQVFDRDTGVEKTVTLAGGTAAYLTVSNPETNFVCLTYKDVTFVVNKAVTVAMGATLSTSRDTEGIITVDDYVSGATYSVEVTINGTPYSITPTGTSVNTVAADIKTDLEALGGWPGTVTTTVYNNVVHITDSADQLESINVGDNRSGTAISAFTDKVLKVGDLPPYAPDGFIAKVTGAENTTEAEDANTADDQYYAFEANDGSGGSGRWVETVAPGIKYAIDATTAPHILTRNSGGTFDFTTIPWGSRDVGDTFTNPDPVFIDQTIANVFLLGNRLGFLAGSQFILSRVGEESYYEFFRSTTSTQLDDDPVYGTVPSQEVNELYHALAWNSELILLGSPVDGVVTYGNKLALSELNISTPTATGASPLVSPILSDSDILFITESGDFSNFNSYQLAPISGKRVPESITEDYLGRYIPKNVTQLAGTPKSFAAAFSTETRDKLYVLTYTKKEERVIQRAVVTWDFSEVSEMDILRISVNDNWLYITYIGPGDKIYVGRLDISAGASDDEWPFKCYLDHRQTVTGSYDSGTDQTTFTLSYALTGSDKRAVIATEDNAQTFVAGQDLTIAGSTDTTLVFTGDLSGAGLSIFAGYKINRYMDVNPIYSRAANPNSNQRVANLMNIINVQRIAIGFFNTQYVKAAIISNLDGDELSSKEYIAGLQLDNGYATLDDNASTFTGSLLLDGMGHTDREAKLRISSESPKPFFIDSVQWLANESSALI